MKQWIMDIPAFAETFLNNMDEIDWPESTKEMQRNWIGKSIGAEVTFKVDGTSENFTVFTTRCDTLFGATYCVLSPEHPLIDKITTQDKKKEVEKYQKECASKSEMEDRDLIWYRLPMMKEEKISWLIALILSIKKKVQNIMFKAIN